MHRDTLHSHDWNAGGGVFQGQVKEHYVGTVAPLTAFKRTWLTLCVIVSPALRQESLSLLSLSHSLSLLSLSDSIGTCKNQNHFLILQYTIIVLLPFSPSVNRASIYNELYTLQRGHKHLYWVGHYAKAISDSLPSIPGVVVYQCECPELVVLKDRWHNVLPGLWSTAKLHPDSVKHPKWAWKWPSAALDLQTFAEAYKCHPGRLVVMCIGSLIHHLQRPW